MVAIHRSRADHLIVEALEENWIENRRTWAAIPTLTLRDDNRFFWFKSGLPRPSLNAVLRARLEKSSVDIEIQSAIQWFTKSIEAFAWIVGPSTIPESLEAHLKNQGFIQVGDIPGMALKLPKSLIPISCPTDLVIKTVTNKTRFRDWKSVLFNHREGVSPQRDITYKYQVASAQYPEKFQFVGYWQKKPVAITTLLLHHGTAGIYSVITLESARKQGIGTAMTQYALRTAQRNGYSLSTLQASDAGINIYKKIGFQTVYEFPVYVFHR